MLGIFKSNYNRAVREAGDFIADVVAPLGEPPGAALRDPYCLGFLQIVGMHVAAQTLKGSTSEKAAAAFDDALKIVAPTHASDAAELLKFIQYGTSPGNEAYLCGKKDGDTFMGFRLHRLAPQRDGEAALERFFDRVRHIMSRPPAPPRLQEPPLQTRAQTPSGRTEITSERTRSHQEQENSEQSLLEIDMEIWVKLTPGQGDEVWLVKLNRDGAFNSRFVLKSLPTNESPMVFALDLAKWMNIKARTVFEEGGSFVAQVRYDPLSQSGSADAATSLLRDGAGQRAQTNSTATEEARDRERDKQTYNRDNIRQFIILIKGAYAEIQKIQNEPDAVNLYARAACEMAVQIRNVAGVDILSLSFPLTKPPFPPSHPLVRALSPLEHSLETAVNTVDAADPKSRAFAEAVLMMQVALVWKGYLFLLNTSLENWSTIQYCAMGALRILSTADHDQVITGLKVLPTTDPGVRAKLKDEDWPPRGFLKLWFAHRSVIAPRLGWPA